MLILILQSHSQFTEKGFNKTKHFEQDTVFFLLTLDCFSILVWNWDVTFLRGGNGSRYGDMLFLSSV